MNHLENSFQGKNTFWRYLIMLAAIFAATNTIGAIPLIISIGIKIAGDPGVAEKLALSPNDPGILGIDPNLYLLEMIFPFVIGLAAFWLLIKPLNGRTMKQVINGTGSFRWERLLISAAVWTLFAAIYLFASLKIDPDNYSLNNTSQTLIPLVLISVLFIPFQAAWEEVIFRGYLMQGFTVWMRNRWMPVVATSVLFAAMHVINPEVKEYGFWNMMPQYLLFGLIFGVMTVLDDGVEAAIGAHAANNAFLSVMVTSKGSVLQTPAVYEQHKYYPMTEFFLMLIMGMLILLVLKVIFRWKNSAVLLGKVEPPVPEEPSFQMS
ncbi:MAG: CPBP family intramembrane metalloprotease [Bacteroidales bacterium]|nr:CPBP family intramembrane metalloprotease [Bacteroidales bacterium]MBN2634557.1 CPBP family intramembrane metalloprotease [Bacteroidales bacterium]